MARLLGLGAPDQSGREQCGLGGLEQRAERLRAAAKAAAMSSRMMDSIGPMSQSMSLYTLTAAETQRSDVQLLRTSGLTATSEQILKEAIVDNGPSCGLRRSMTATARMSPTLSAPCPPFEDRETFYWSANSQAAPAHAHHPEGAVNPSPSTFPVFCLHRLPA